jgi:hypothetical protein
MNSRPSARAVLGCSLASVLACCGGHGRTTGNIGIRPAAPSNVQATAQDAAVSLAWSPAADAASYTVYYAAAPSVTPSNYATLPEGHSVAVSTAWLLVTGLTNATTYTFVVTAWNATLTLESGPSAAAQATPVAAGTPGFTAPTTLPAGSVADTTATLAGQFSNPIGYTTSVWFEYGPSTAYGTATPAQFFAAAGAIGITAPLTGLLPQSVHHFRLVTQNAGGRFAGVDRTFLTLAQPQVLLANLNAPTGLPYDGTYVYLYEVYGGRVRRVDAATGAATTLASIGGSGNSGAIAVRGGYVYFADGGAVYRVGTDGTGLVLWSLHSETGALLPHATGLYVRHQQTISRRSRWRSA